MLTECSLAGWEENTQTWELGSSKSQGAYLPLRDRVCFLLPRAWGLKARRLECASHSPRRLYKCRFPGLPCAAAICRCVTSDTPTNDWNSNSKSSPHIMLESQELGSVWAGWSRLGVSHEAAVKEWVRAWLGLEDPFPRWLSHGCHVWAGSRRAPCDMVADFPQNKWAKREQGRRRCNVSSDLASEVTPLLP